MEEASAAVWKKFEKVLYGMNVDALSILERHLDGMSAYEIGQEKKLTEEEVSTLLKRLKRELIQHLRQECHVRH